MTNYDPLTVGKNETPFFVVFCPSFRGEVCIEMSRYRGNFEERRRLGLLGRVGRSDMYLCICVKRWFLVYNFKDTLQVLLIDTVIHPVWQSPLPPYFAPIFVDKSVYTNEFEVSVPLPIVVIHIYIYIPDKCKQLKIEVTCVTSRWVRWNYFVRFKVIV